MDSSPHAWLGVVSAEHVRRGVDLGIAQVNHGKRAGLARMRPGDVLVYYSAQERLGDRPTLRSFTAYGVVADDEIWQADEGSFRPFRRRVSYDEGARVVPLEEVRAELELTRDPNWGHLLRRGLVPLSAHDAKVLRPAMTTEYAAR
jgi:hypothetical protein